MTKSWEKYISKNKFRNELKKIVEDISNDDLSWYVLVKLKWYKNHYRIRKGKIRIVFIRQSIWNEIVAVDTRWDVYKWIKNLLN